MHRYEVRYEYSTLNDADKCGPKVQYLLVSVYPNVPLKGYLLIKEPFDIIHNLPSIGLI